MKSQTNFKEIIKFRGDLKDLPQIAKGILDKLPSNAVIALEGNLAAGKTTLTNEIVKYFGISGVTSPTFSLQQIYDETIFHYDFYRVDMDQIATLGLLEEFEKDGLHFVEWANSSLLSLLYKSGFTIYKIEIELVGNLREYILKVASEV